MSDTERRVGADTSGDRFWAGLALPGVVWLCIFFLLPFYVILCVALGTRRSDLPDAARPSGTRSNWNTAAFEFVFEGLFTRGAAFQTVFVRTFVYVVIATALSLLIAYPVAYYVARYGGRWKGLLLVGLIAPFFIRYLMRMLAWINLLQDDGWVNDVLVWLGILDAPRNWLDGRASSVILGLVYGYVPFMILPLYAFLDRIDRSLLEAARDLGASPFQAFRMVTLPLSMPAILAGIVIIALPMFGDYYTPDLLSGAPQTSLIGNQINLYIRGGQQIPVGAALVVVLMLFLLGPHGLLHLCDRPRRSGGWAAHESRPRLVGEPVGEAALPRPLHGALPRLVDRPDPHRDPLLVQRGAVALDLARLVAALVHGRPRPLRPARHRAELGADAEPAARRDRRARHRAARGRTRRSG